jgi:hypothetical protein
MKVDQQEPLLLLLAREQAPASPRPDGERYDNDLDQLVVLDGNTWVCAATRPDRPPQTKKADVERGEDVKGW